MKLSKNIGGYTLTEVMVALVVGTILISSAMATYIAQNRSYTTQESVSEANTQSKTAYDMLSNDIKNAGFGIPDGMNIDPINGLTTVVSLIDSTSAPDTITLVGAFRRIGTLWPLGGSPGMACPAQIPMGATQISIILDNPAADPNRTDRPNTTNRRYLSFDGVDYAEVVSCTSAGADCASGGTVTLDRPLRIQYPLEDTDGGGSCDTGRPVYLVEDVTYCVDANGTLRRIRNGNAATCTGNASITDDDDEAIAENIEDLQFAYALDADNNGMLDGGGYINNGAIPNPEAIRAVRVNVLATSDREDDNYTGQGNPPANIENRAHVQPDDGLRRRWWQKIVTIRNLRGQ